MGKVNFQIMDQSGHSTEVYERADKVSVEEAMKRFDELTKDRKMIAAVRNPPGSSCTMRVVKAFDPDADEMVFVPPLKGG